MQRWTGVIAYLDTPTVDGRVLRTPGELRTGDLPLPLGVLDEEPQRTDVAVFPHAPGPIGTVDSVAVVGNELRAEGAVRDGLLEPGEEMPVGVDLDRVSSEWSDADEAQVFTDWRLRGVTAYRGKGEPAWPGAHIRLSD